MFGHRKKAVLKKSRVSSDEVIIGAAKTIGSAIGTAAVAVEIGRQSAIEAHDSKAAVAKQMQVLKKNANGQKARELLEPAAQQLSETSKMAKGKAKEAQVTAVDKVQQAREVTTAKVSQVRQKAERRSDELRAAAAEKIAPKKKRGLLGRLRR